ncbi:hypothetical protein [Terrabacter terrae]
MSYRPLTTDPPPQQRTRDARVLSDSGSALAWQVVVGVRVV